MKTARQSSVRSLAAFIFLAFPTCAPRLSSPFALALFLYLDFHSSPFFAPASRALCQERKKRKRERENEKEQAGERYGAKAAQIKRRERARRAQSAKYAVIKR